MLPSRFDQAGGRPEPAIFASSGSGLDLELRAANSTQSHQIAPNRTEKNFPRQKLRPVAANRSIPFFWVENPSSHFPDREGDKFACF